MGDLHGIGDSISAPRCATSAASLVPGLNFLAAPKLSVSACVRATSPVTTPIPGTNLTALLLGEGLDRATPSSPGQDRWLLDYGFDVDKLGQPIPFATSVQ